MDSAKKTWIVKLILLKMEFLKTTDGEFKRSPVNSNLVISEETQECIAIVMSGTYNGIAFPESRVEKQGNAELVARSKSMYEFLINLYDMLDKLAIGDVNYDESRKIREVIENLIKK